MFPFLPIAVLGVLAGMLVNYLSDVLPLRRRLAPPLCTHCGTPQALGAYFIWPRRCPNCGQRRSLRVWLVEIGFVALFVWL